MDNKVEIALLIIFAIIFGVYVIYTENKMKNYTLNTNCTKPSGIFSVENGNTYSSTDDVLETCYDGKTNCIFNNVTTLTDAVNICNINELCKRFAYSSSTSTLTLLKTTSKYSANKNSDIYNREV